MLHCSKICDTKRNLPRVFHANTAPRDKNAQIFMFTDTGASHEATKNRISFLFSFRDGPLQLPSLPLLSANLSSAHRWILCLSPVPVGSPRHDRPSTNKSHIIVQASRALNEFGNECDPDAEATAKRLQNRSIHSAMQCDVHQRTSDPRHERRKMFREHGFNVSEQCCCRDLKWRHQLFSMYAPWWEDILSGQLLYSRARSSFTVARSFSPY